MKSSKTYSAKSNTGLMTAGAVAFLVIAAVLNICLGASGTSLARLWEALLSGPGESAASRILWYVRLPRTAATLLAGAGLAVSGAVIQKVLSNNLASPGIIGVNAGAGTAVAICCGLGVYSAWAIAGASFIGALCATFLVVMIGRRTHASKTTVVLAGVAVTACLSAVTETIITIIWNNLMLISVYGKNEQTILILMRIHQLVNMKH